MNFSKTKDWDEYLTRNYRRLVGLARTLHKDAEDLVHNCYLICREREDVRNPHGYFVKVMRREAYSGHFKKLYRLTDTPDFDGIQPEPDHDPLVREQMELYIDRLHRFDRLVWKLHNDGYSMVEIAKGTGIPLQTLYNSLNYTRKVITQCFLHQAKSETLA